MLNFFDWAYQNGGKLAEELDYVPMPANVVSSVEAELEDDRRARRQAGLDAARDHERPAGGEALEALAGLRCAQETERGG